MFDYILFDLDGTLTDSAPGITSCVEYALSKFGIKVADRAELKNSSGRRSHIPSKPFSGFRMRKRSRQRNITANASA